MREAKERIRIDQIKAASRQRHRNVNTKTEVIRRINVLPPNRELIREIIKYKNKDYKFSLQIVKAEISRDKIRLAIN